MDVVLFLSVHVLLHFPRPGTSAVGTKIVKTGLVSFFPPEFSIVNRSGILTSLDYDIVNNVDSEETIVTLEMSYQIGKTAASKTGVTVEATLNGVPINLPSFNIAANVSGIEKLAFCR